MTDTTIPETLASGVVSTESYRTHGLMDGWHAVVKRDTMEHPVDACATRSRQLFALTSIIYGIGYESFMTSVDPIKNDFLCLLSDIALEVMVLADLAAKVRRGGDDVQA